MSRLAAELLFTDLDGTLLDHDTYSYREALPGLETVRSLRIPLVMVSSKTFPEMAELHAELSLNSPFIFENGGGIAWPEPESPDGFAVELLGPPIDALLAAVPLLERALACGIVPITAMDPGELASVTGLTPERARLAQLRRASLPFLLRDAGASLPPDMTGGGEPVEGFRITRGGRFYHLIGAAADKGTAVTRVAGRYMRMWGWDSLVSGGIGDNENDIPLLRAVTLPVLVQRHDGGYAACDFEVTRMEGMGPAGFSEAVKWLCAGE
jgi:mannosyl-3-phosphoglycerate phosphatase